MAGRATLAGMRAGRGGGASGGAGAAARSSAEGIAVWAAGAGQVRAGAPCPSGSLAAARRGGERQLAARLAQLRGRHREPAAQPDGLGILQDAQSRLESTWKSFLVTSHARSLAYDQHVGRGQLGAADLGEPERGAEPPG